MALCLGFGALGAAGAFYFYFGGFLNTGAWYTAELN
jgi:hypothetical protein